MRTALVYDRINKWGGAERVLLALHGIWPNAPLYTSVYKQNITPWADVFRIYPSIMNKINFFQTRHEYLASIMPFLYEQFNFDNYECIISITSADAKGLITKPETCHICYLLTPSRYLWNDYDTYYRNPGFGILNGFVRIFLKHTIKHFKSWDMFASQRPDAYIAISKRVADRCIRYYGIKPRAIVNPPIDTEKFYPSVYSSKTTKIDKVSELFYKNNYFLIVSRLVRYKRVDIVIDACSQLGVPLVVIGSGREQKNLKKRARSNIRFLGNQLTDKELLRYYQGCRAYLFAGEEDFGIAAGEAQACGKPVIAYKNSGIEEIVKDNITGLLFKQQTVISLIQAIKQFNNMNFSIENCRKNAQRFSKARFETKIKKVIMDIYLDYQKRLLQGGI